MIIGIFIFYSQFLPLNKMDIRPYKCIFVKTDPTRRYVLKGGYVTDVEPMDTIGPKLMEMLKEDILSGTTLARLDHYRIFYIKKD